MDSLTQAILGIAVAHVGFSNSVSKTKTILFGAVVATIPDLDIYLAKLFNDPLTEIELHRGFSHSILFFLLLAGIICFLKPFFKNVSLSKFYFITFFVLLTHSLLDVFTTWGTQLLWWHPQKIALKSVFVVDFFYTVPLLIGLISGLKKNNTQKTKIGLLVSSLYLCWGLFAQSMIKSTAENQFKASLQKTIDKITIKPTFSNTILWNVLIETKDGYYLADRSLFDKNSIKFQYYPNQHHLIKHIAKDKNIQRLITISEQQYIITTNEKGLVFNDLRFGLLKKDQNNVQFAFSYQLIPTNNGIQVQELPKDHRDGKQLLKNIWNRIF